MNHDHDRIAIIIFAITTITYTRTDLWDPRRERGTSAEPARLSAGGQALAAFRYARLTAQTPAHKTDIKQTTIERRVKQRLRILTSLPPLSTAAPSS